MRILAVESSAKTVSTAVLEDGKIVCELFENNGLTHSVTLLPQIKEALLQGGLSVNDVDVFALSSGPGSFTGLRIGAATVKGLAANGAGTLGVSTLEAMAYCHRDFEGVICCLMDARCSQVYNALFSFEGGKIQRLCEDRALMIDELLCELKEIDKPILLVGDGAALTKKTVDEKIPENKNIELAEGESVFQRASGVCLCAYEKIMGGQKPVNSYELNLEYLRLPQAERELKKKEKKL